MNLDQWMVLLLTEHVIGTVVGIYLGVKLTILVLKKIPMVGPMIPDKIDWRFWK